MKIGDLIRPRIRMFTNSEGYSEERTPVNVFPQLSLCSSIGVLQPNHLGIILEISIVDIKIFIPESGLTGWVSAGFVEMVSETG